MPEFSGSPLGAAFIEIGGDLSRLSKDFARAKGMTTSAVNQLGKQAKLKLGLNIAGFRAGLNKAKQQLSTNLKSLNTQVRTSQEQLQKNYGALFDMSRRVGMGMVAAGGAITGAFALAVRTTANFQQSMANVVSVVGDDAPDALQKLTDYARVMGKQSVFSASQAADAMYYLASAGYDTEKIMGSLEGTLKLAAATQSDLAFTTETVVSTLAGFRMEASEANRVSNVFAAAISGSQAKMDRLSISMSYVAPVAKSVNLSLEQTVAILGQLYNAGIEASTAGTALRMGIAQLLDPTAETISTMERLGVALYDTTGKVRPFLDIIRDLEKANIEAADTLAIFGIRAGPSMLTLIQQGTESLDKLTAQITGTDKAAEMAATQINTFKGAMKLFKSAVEELQISIGTTLLPMLTSGIKHFTSMTNAVSTLTTKFPALTGAIAKLGAVLGPMVLAGGVLAIATPTLVTMAKGVILLKTAILVSAVPAIAKFGSALLALAANPYVAAATAIAALTTALVLYTRRANDAKRITEELEVAVENLPTLSKIEIEVHIEKAQRRLQSLQAQYWDLIEQQKKLTAIFETETKPGFGKVSKTEVGSTLAVIGDRLRANKKAYNDIDQALRKLLVSQGKYSYAAIEVSDEMIKKGEEEIRLIGQRIWKLREENQYYDEKVKKIDEGTNPALIKRWTKGLEVSTAAVKAAEAEYAEADKRLQGMYASQMKVGEATTTTSEALKGAKKPTDDLEAAHTALAAALSAVESKQTLLNKSLSAYQSQLGKISEVAGEAVRESVKDYQDHIPMGEPEIPFPRREEMELGFAAMYASDLAQQKQWATRGAEIREQETQDAQDNKVKYWGWVDANVAAFNREQEQKELARQAKAAGIYESKKEAFISAYKDRQIGLAAFYAMQKQERETDYAHAQDINQRLQEGWQDLTDAQPLMEWGRIASNVARSTEYAFTDLFASMIDPSVKPAWAQFWDSLKRIAINAIAEIAVKMAALKWTGAGLPGAEAMLSGAIGGIGKAAGITAGGVSLGTVGLGIAGAFGLYKLFDALSDKEDKAERTRAYMADRLAQIAAEEAEANDNLGLLSQTITNTTALSTRQIVDAIFDKQRGARPSVPRGELVYTQWTGDFEPTRLERLQASRPGRPRTLTQFQFGGIVTRPTVAMIGEAGPEAIIPLRSGGPQMQIQPQIIQPNITMSPGAIQITEEYPNVRLDTMTMDQRIRMYEKTLRPVVEEWVSRGMFLNARR